MLAVLIKVVEVEAAIANSNVIRAVSDILEGFFVGKGMKWIVVKIASNGEVEIGVELCLAGVPDTHPLWVVASFALAIRIKRSIGGLVSDVPRERVAIEHLPFVVPVDGIGRFAPTASFVTNEVKILRNEAGDVREKIARSNTAKRTSSVSHDVVEVNLEAEAVGDSNQGKEFGFGPILCADRPGLIDIAEIKSVVSIKSYRVSSRGAFEWRRKPE